jgi:hypothetical protein
MVADFPKLIEVRGWRAVLEPSGHYSIYSSPYSSDYRGSAPTPESAKEWLEEGSGLKYDSLPAIKLDDLTVQHGTKQRSGHHSGWYRHTFYYLGDKLLGKIQTTSSRFKAGGKSIERISTLTCAGDGDGCVLGSDLRWMLKVNGYRLVD